MRPFLGLLVLLALPTHSVAADAPRDVSAILAEVRAKHDVPALCGAIVNGNSLEAVGVDGVRERGKPEKAAVDDKWHLGSCTKAMTATLCGVLVEEKKLSFDDTVAKTWPATKCDPAWKDVPLWSFLHHRSGAPQNFAGLDAAPRYGISRSPSEDRRNLVERMFAAPPLYALGSKNLYSNAGLTTAGAFAEKAGGKPWETLMRERIFEPLGMKSAGFGPPGTAEKVDQPRGHTEKGVPVPPGPAADNPPAMAPAGTVHASIGDWAKFVAAHVVGERDGGSSLLKPKTFRKLHEPVGDDPKYGAGWVVVERDWAGPGGRVLTHTGTNRMWFAVTWLAPDRGFAVLVCCNQPGDIAKKACDDAAWALIRDHLATATR